MNYKIAFKKSVARDLKKIGKEQELMQAITNEEVKAILLANLDNAEISVDGDGYQYQITIVSQVFSGKNTIQRHKTIYSLLNDVISDGRLHALSLKTLTPEEKQGE